MGWQSFYQGLLRVNAHGPVDRGLDRLAVGSPNCSSVSMNIALTDRRFTWGIEMTCNPPLTCYGHSLELNATRRLHTIPSTIGSDQVEDVSRLDCRASVRIDHAARHRGACGQLEI